MESKSEMIQAAEGFLRNSKSKVARSDLRYAVKRACSDHKNNRCSDCGKPTAYNGWKNYETWSVALWIDNDEGTHNERLEMAKRAREQAEENPPSYASTVEERVRILYVDALKEWVESELCPELPASLASDLLGAALSEVDYYEIAGSWLSEE